MDNVTVRLPGGLRQALDAFAKRRGLERSNVLRIAVTEFLAKQIRPGDYLRLRCPRCQVLRVSRLQSWDGETATCRCEACGFVAAYTRTEAITGWALWQQEFITE